MFFSLYNLPNYNAMSVCRNFLRCILQRVFFRDCNSYISSLYILNNYGGCALQELLLGLFKTILNSSFSAEIHVQCSCSASSMEYHVLPPDCCHRVTLKAAAIEMNEDNNQG
jgi:hypothetical protein